MVRSAWMSHHRESQHREIKSRCWAQSGGTHAIGEAGFAKMFVLVASMGRSDGMHDQVDPWGEKHCRGICSGTWLCRNQARCLAKALKRGLWGMRVVGSRLQTRCVRNGPEALCQVALLWGDAGVTKKGNTYMRAGPAEKRTKGYPSQAQFNTVDDNSWHEISRGPF